MTKILDTLSDQIYTEEQLLLINKTLLPRHVAIIPDGNRRWARMNGNSIFAGHRTGANAVFNTVKAARELGIEAITFYLFSTENWKRSQDEIAFHMELLQEFLLKHCDEMKENGVRLKTIGTVESFPVEVVRVINQVAEATADGTKIDMILALNYGSRDEIRRVIQHICKENASENPDFQEITEELISSCLDTAPWGDPDLLIRTSGEMRVSNFLLWQLSYTELYVTDILWPDFTPEVFLDALIDFQTRQRRMGGGM